MSNLEETFEYDSQNRLKKVWLGPTLTGASVYDSYGRMTAKTANGQLIFYDAEFGITAKPHAMNAATTVAENFPQVSQTVTYTGFDKVCKIKQGNDSLCYTYGYDRQRVFMEEHVGNRHRTKRYVGNCEYVTESEGGSDSEHWLTYLSGPMGVYAVVLTKSGSSQVFYILKDNLGSWTTITDEHGNVEQRLSYDPWGNLRDPDTWANYTPNDVFNKPMFDRGYTGHEHLSAFGLINMNGRMYDPKMSSFLSADRYVSNPLTTQGFNRYAYCLNNPLRYTDPSGWLPGGAPDGPLRRVVIGGETTFILPEVVVLGDNPSLANYNTYEEFWYTPNLTGGGRNLQGNNVDPSTSIGPRGGTGGGSHGGTANNKNNSSFNYWLSDYFQKYQHYLQTSKRDCKIAVVRSYYQYFSGIDKGESYFSTLVNGMILVDRNTYLSDFYEECGLIVKDGMGVNIFEIGQELEEGHPYSIVLKGENIPETTDMDHVVTMIGIKKRENTPLLIYINDPIYKEVQVYQWVYFRDDIKDAYFITGLKKP